ncbi:MAG: hypothetical protein J6B63_02920, partial [Treponema sp.]|nr:hypothetical protein [Treponema sp.]
DGVKLHLYGKTMTSPRRKMGHLTVTNKDINTAIKNAEDAFSKIKITAKEEY